MLKYLLDTARIRFIFNDADNTWAYSKHNIVRSCLFIIFLDIGNKVIADFLLKNIMKLNNFILKLTLKKKKTESGTIWYSHHYWDVYYLKSFIKIESKSYQMVQG